MCVLVRSKSADHTNPAGREAKGKGFAMCPGAQGHHPVLPPDLGSLSQKYKGGEQQEGHEGATFTGHGRVFRLHSAPAAPAAAAATKAESSDGHQQEVETSNHSTHHVARLIPNHLGKAARREGSSGSQEWGECPCASTCVLVNPHRTHRWAGSLLITIVQMK